MDLKIEKGVPVPSRPAPLYPFLDMEKGDSFVLPLGWKGRVAMAAWKVTQKHGLGFIIRKISDTEARCWRVK